MATRDYSRLLLKGMAAGSLLLGVSICALQREGIRLRRWQR